MMKMANVSVIICVRNGEAYLREALDSIYAQNLSDLETIVIDDGSEDRTAEIARSHAIRAQVITRPASGHPASLNAGLDVASRDFIAFLDADDVWPSTRLRDMVGVFESDPGIEIVCGQIVNTNELLEPKQPPFTTRQLTCSLVRRHVFAKVGRFRTDVTHASSVDWTVRAAVMGIPMKQLDSVVLLRRIHADNMGVRDVSRGRQDLLRVVREHRARTRNA
ncbi:MAG: glycosyltransferase family A protein [Dongiaceae bacterium]